jgi:hypothetical protein
VEVPVNDFEAYLESLPEPTPEERRRIMWAVFSITENNAATVPPLPPVGEEPPAFTAWCALADAL